MLGNQKFCCTRSGTHALGFSLLLKEERAGPRSGSKSGWSWKEKAYLWGMFVCGARERPSSEAAASRGQQRPWASHDAARASLLPAGGSLDCTLWEKLDARKQVPVGYPGAPFSVIFA